MSFGIGVLLLYDMASCKKKHCVEHTSHLVSSSALKNFLGSTALEHKGAGATFVRHGLQFLFLKPWASFSIGRIRDIIPQGSKDSIRSNLQDWGERRLDDTLSCFWLWPRCCQRYSVLEAYTTLCSVQICNCHLSPRHELSKPLWGLGKMSLV